MQDKTVVIVTTMAGLEGVKPGQDWFTPVETGFTREELRQMVDERALKEKVGTPGTATHYQYALTETGRKLLNGSNPHPPVPSPLDKEGEQTPEAAVAVEEAGEAAKAVSDVENPTYRPASKKVVKELTRLRFLNQGASERFIATDVDDLQAHLNAGWEILTSHIETTILPGSHSKKLMLIEVYVLIAEAGDDGLEAPVAAEEHVVSVNEVELVEVDPESDELPAPPADDPHPPAPSPLRKGEKVKAVSGTVILPEDKSRTEDDGSYAAGLKLGLPAEEMSVRGDAEVVNTFLATLQERQTIRVRTGEPRSLGALLPALTNGGA